MSIGSNAFEPEPLEIGKISESESSLANSSCCCCISSSTVSTGKKKNKDASAAHKTKVKGFKRQKKEAAKGPLPACLSIPVEGGVPSSEYEGRGGGMPRTKPKSGDQEEILKYWMDTSYVCKKGKHPVNMKAIKMPMPQQRLKDWFTAMKAKTPAMTKYERKRLMGLSRGGGPRSSEDL